MNQPRSEYKGFESHSKQHVFGLGSACLIPAMASRFGKAKLGMTILRWLREVKVSR
jgi:hypothetical protein